MNDTPDLVTYCALRTQGREAVWDDMNDRVVWVWRNQVGDRSPLTYNAYVQLTKEAA